MGLGPFLHHWNPWGFSSDCKTQVNHGRASRAPGSGQWLVSGPLVSLLTRENQYTTLMRLGRLQAPFWHPLNLCSGLSVLTPSLSAKHPSVTPGKPFPTFSFWHEWQWGQIHVCGWWRRHPSPFVGLTMTYPLSSSGCCCEGGGLDHSTEHQEVELWRMKLQKSGGCGWK